MPELPEVETVRRGLAELLPGKRILGVDFDWPKSFPNAETDVSEFLIGAKVLEVKRRAKVLLIELDSKYSLVIHLKMTGQLVYVKKLQSSQADAMQGSTEQRSKAYKKYGARAAEVLTPQSTASDSRVSSSATKQAGTVRGLEERFGAGHPNASLISDLPNKSTRVTFELDNSARLFFNDQRKFGWVRLIPTAEIPNIDFFKKVGPEPLAADFTSKAFRDRLLKRPNTNIKAAILDQSVIAGIGNIYADEGLWEAKIHPSLLVKNVSTAKMNTLFTSLRDVLQLSIDKGGSSDRNYVDAEGKRGSYLSFANVFRREGKPCTRCGTTIIKTRVAGRGTHTCPKCQKETK